MCAVLSHSKIRVTSFPWTSTEHLGYTFSYTWLKQHCKPFSNHAFQYNSWRRGLIEQSKKVTSLVVQNARDDVLCMFFVSVCLKVDQFFKRLLFIFIYVILLNLFVILQVSWKVEPTPFTDSSCLWLYPSFTWWLSPWDIPLMLSFTFLLALRCDHDVFKD